MTRYWILAGLLTALTSTPFAAAQAPAPVRLVIKPVLCVLEKTATTCSVTFDISWKSELPADYCLEDSVNPEPLHCWQRSVTGDMKHERSFSEDFAFWLTPPDRMARISEVRIEILRVGSTDRRRERRTRHVWDVL